VIQIKVQLPISLVRVKQKFLQQITNSMCWIILKQKNVLFVMSLSTDEFFFKCHIKAKRPGDPTQVVLQARGKLRAISVDRAANNRVYINEDLSENTRKIFGAARAKLKSKLLTSAWTSNGRIHVKDNNGSFSHYFIYVPATSSRTYLVSWYVGFSVAFIYV
jgi:hypothetical protein